jgi:LacI family transcriptional regulator
MYVSRIAAKAGVSIATVSRVLNNSRPVNPKLRERVHKAMEELKLPARPLRRRNKSRAADAQHATIAIVSVGQAYRSWFELPVIAGVVAELTRAAQDHHMGVLITEMPDPNQLSPVLRRSEVDGAIAFIDSRLGTKDTAVLRDHLPVVRVMGGQLAPIEIDHIGADNNAVGYLACEHLLSHGVREIACLTIQPSWDLIRLRAQGFMAAAIAAGVTPYMYVAGESKSSLPFFGPHAIAAPGLAPLIERLASNHKGRIGLFVTRDEETVHVYPLLRQAGLEPGRDVVVVSCDNEAVRLSTLAPRPASIDLGAADIARHAVRRLAARIKHRDEPPVRILVNPTLIPADAADAAALAATSADTQAASS